MTRYYRHFIKNYGEITTPLIQLLQKNAFARSEESTSAFDKLKHAMVTIPMLALQDFTKTFVVETDALGFGLGAVLMQDNRPIARNYQREGELNPGTEVRDDIQPKSAKIPTRTT